MFKKIQIIFMVCVLFIGILPSLGLEAKAAEQVTAAGFSYELTADGQGVIITGYDDEISLTPNIPSEIGGKPVVEIGNDAFAHKKITEITIPDSVTTIGGFAFAITNNLTTIKLPNNLESIGEVAFEEAKGLTSIEIPSNVKYLGKQAFKNATSLTSIKFHTPATILDENVFESVPDGLKVTGFKGSKLERYVEASNASTPGKYIFEGLEYEVTAKDFDYELTEDQQGIIITGYSDNISLKPKIPSEIEGKPVVEIADNVFKDSEITTIKIPDSVTRIGDKAFSGATGLTSIKLPNSLKNIGNYAFYGATGLTSITLPNSVTSIGGSAFSGATGITSIEIPNGVTSIGDSTFEGATGLKSITIPDSVTSIGDSAFYKATGLMSITLPNSVTNIGSYAFYKATGLTSITLPNSVTSIGSYAFYKATGLTSITLPNSLTHIENSIFSGTTGLTSIEIPDSVESIEDEAFSGMTGLTSIRLPDSLESIGDEAFSGMTGITSIEIPNNVESIGDYAFEGATSLKIIKFNTPSYMGEDMFYDIPDGLKVIGFKDSRLEKYINDSNEESAGRFIFEGSDYKLRDSDFRYELTEDKEGAIITGYNDSVLSNPIIPSTFEGKPVVEIGESAFYDSEITGITIPKTVTAIGEWAFEDTRSLRSIEIPNGVVSIGDFAFEDTRKLTSITIPNSVKSIGEGAFEDAKILESIEIPNSVETIGDYAFEDMEALKTITFHNPLTTLGEDVFKDVLEGLKIIGFKDSIVAAYIKAGNDASPNRFIFESLSYKVTFNSNGGTKVTSANTNEKRLVTQPKAPTKANHRFEGWYTDAKYKTKWDFKTAVEKDVTLYAKWTFVAPAILLKNSTISDATVQVTGTTSPNSAIRILQGSKEIGKGKSDAKGNFTIKISKVKAGSTGEIQVTDAYGTKKSFKKTVADKTAPEVTVPKVNSASTKISGTAEAKSKIELVINGKVTKVKTSDKGNYSINIKKQKAGTKMTLTVSDAAGNKTTKTITVLAAPKPVTLASISDKQQTITGKTEAKAKVAIYVNDKLVKTVTANSKGEYSYKVGKKKAGTSIKVVATDQAGNTTTKTVKVLDKTAPAKPSVKSVKASSTTVVGKAEAGSTVYVYKGKTLLGEAKATTKGSYTVKIKKQKKGTTLLVKALDKAKNASKNTSIKVK